MATVLKSGRSNRAECGRRMQVRDTVAKIIEAIDARGDDALREYSAKFANWESSSFHLSESDIEACFAQMSKSDIDDIRFAHAGSVSA